MIKVSKYVLAISAVAALTFAANASSFAASTGGGLVAEHGTSGKMANTNFKGRHGRPMMHARIGGHPKGMHVRHFVGLKPNEPATKSSQQGWKQ